MKNFCLILIIAAFSLQFSTAQRTISGMVTDVGNKQPLIGASVLITGTSLGTVTDVDGKFSLEAPASAAFLNVSFVGYTSQTVSVAGIDRIDVALRQGTDLSEVVVVGYTSVRKQDLTGAIAVVDLSTIKNPTSGNPMQALQGSVPGLYIEKNGGDPSGDNSRILIRGANTLGNTDPLYIIDGVPTKRPEVFQSLTGIKSIQVLKDASSSSIYGSRASNGVIIVTTNNGGNTEGKLNIQFNTSMSVQSEKSERFTMLNSIDRGKALWRASVNDGVDPAAGFGEIYAFDWNKNFANPVLNSVSLQPYVGGDKTMPAGNTDWQDALYQTAYVSNNDLTLSAGNKTSSVLMNMAYFTNSGLVKFTGYNRMTGRLNAMTSGFDGHFRFGMNSEISSSNLTPVASDLGGAPTPGLAITLAPTIPVYTTDGRYAGPLGSGYSDRNNPIDMQYINRWNNVNKNFIFGNIYAEIEPVTNLILRTSVGLDRNIYTAKNIAQSFQEGSIGRSLNSLNIYTGNFTSLTWSNTARYNFSLGRSSFKLLAGIEAIKDDVDNFNAYKENFAVQTQDFFVLSAGTGNASNSESASGSRLLSQFGRLDYSFADKYLLTATVRRDGSSRFGENNRFGVFPAVSVGWRIDQEDFMKSLTVVDNLKLRVGYGQVGNQDIGDLARFGLFEPRYGVLQSQESNGHQGFFDQFYNIGTAYDINGAKTGSLPSGFVSIQGPNPSLKWETTKEVNTGLDFGFLKGSLIGSFDYFSRTTSDILINPPVASAVGEGQQKFVNGATKTNKGWELSLGYRGNIKKDLTYGVYTNFGHFRDEITVLPEEVRSAYAGNAVTTIIGHSQFDIFGYKTQGLFQSAADVAGAAKQVGAGPGRIRYADVNGDGVISSLDQVWLGTTLPSLEYGLRINLGYKNFDFSAFGSGVAGRKGFDSYTFYNNFIRSRDNVGPGVFNAWTPQNTGSTIPALTLADGNNETRTSDYFIVNTSYFKLRNIQLGYNLPAHTVPGVQHLRLYLSAENLFVLKSSQFEGPDPERVDVNQVPIPKVFTFGVNLSL